MWTCRSLRRIGSGVLACAVLFMQLVTAAHACGQDGRSGAAAAHAGMPCAGMMDGAAALDADAPGVCQQHCQFGTTQQAAEPMQLLPVHPALPAMLFVLAPAPVESELSTAWRVRERERERAPPLALSIAHCCYRL